MGQEALTWQIGVWDQISQLYVREIDRRFSSVVEAVINRASLRFGERVLDLGTGTGAVACRAAVAVGAMVRLAPRAVLADLSSIGETRRAAAEVAPVPEFAKDSTTA